MATQDHSNWQQFWERYKAACSARGLPADDSKVYAWLDSEYLHFRMKSVCHRNNKKLRREVDELYRA